MIDLSIRNLNDMEFQQALGKLSHCPGFKQKVAYSIAKLSKLIAKETLGARALYKTLLLKYAVVDADGKIVLEDGGEGFKVKEGMSMSDFSQDIETLMQQAVSIEWTKLNFMELDGIGLSPSEIIALEPLIDESTFVPEEEQAKPKIAIVQDFNQTH